MGNKSSSSSSSSDGALTEDEIQAYIIAIIASSPCFEDDMCNVDSDNSSDRSTDDHTIMSDDDSEITENIPSPSTERMAHESNRDDPKQLRSNLFSNVSNLDIFKETSGLNTSSTSLLSPPMSQTRNSVDMSEYDKAARIMSIMRDRGFRPLTPKEFIDEWNRLRQAQQRTYKNFRRNRSVAGFLRGDIQPIFIWKRIENNEFEMHRNPAIASPVVLAQASRSTYNPGEGHFRPADSLHRVENMNVDTYRDDIDEPDSNIAELQTAGTSQYIYSTPQQTRTEGEVGVPYAEWERSILREFDVARTRNLLLEHSPIPSISSSYGLHPRRRPDSQMPTLLIEPYDNAQDGYDDDAVSYVSVNPTNALRVSNVATEIISSDSGISSRSNVSSYNQQS